MPDPIVIVGGGQAAVQVCLALRKEKVETPIVMMSEESHYPYHRPPLSKSYLTGETDDEKLIMRPESFYESKQVEVRLNAAVTEIDTRVKTVTVAAKPVSYRSLILTTGAKPRPLPLNGVDLDGVNLLRDLQDSRRIKQQLESAQHVVIVGAGFIGLEIAAVANQLNKQVTVFDMADRVMARAVSPAISKWFEQTHVNNGIDIRLQDSVAEIIGDQHIKQIKSAAGDVIDCDLLVIGIGVVANDDIAQAAAINCDNGIVVNEFCETSVADVYAAGDCANHPNPFAAGSMVRLESIQNATDQARTVASVIAGKRKPYHSIPWFWSDQGEHALQMAGLSNSADDFVTRGDPASSSFSVFHYLGDKLQSVDSVNSPKDHMLARKLIAANIGPTPAQAADHEFELKSLFQ